MPLRNFDNMHHIPHHRQLLGFAPHAYPYHVVTTRSNLVDKDGCTHTVVVAKPSSSVIGGYLNTTNISLSSRRRGYSSQRGLGDDGSSPLVCSSYSNDDNHEKRTHQQPSRRKLSSSSSSSTATKLASSRALQATTHLPSYLLDARSIDRYHPVTCPGGALQLSVAENQLSEVPLRGVKLLLDDESSSSSGEDDYCELTLMDALSAWASTASPKPSASSSKSNNSHDDVVFDREMIYYQPTQGTVGLRQVMGEYLQGLLLNNPTSNHKQLNHNPKRRFNIDNLILGAGCNAVLENLCMTLADPGDVVLIPTPYYAAFEFDLGSRAGCHVLPVNTMEYHPPGNKGGISSANAAIPASCYYPNKASLDAAYENTLDETNGRPPRILLISHPNNPLGVCYPPHVMKECIDWCRENEVHLISDEIYAGSVYRQGVVADTTTANGEEDARTFVSAMELAADHETSTENGLGLGPYIHLVYALSKDFALSGLRVGVAYTENEEILFALQKLNDFCQISSHTQLLVERMLAAKVKYNGGVDSFVNVYLEANNRNIRARSDKLVQCLDDLNIPYLKPDSGLFLWMDFREFLPQLSPTESIQNESLESKERRERELYLSLMKEYGLLFTPGMSMRNEKAGFFRCVFTAASEEEFELGLVRIRKFVDVKRNGE